MNIVWIVVAVLVVAVVVAGTKIGSGTDAAAAKERIKQGATVIDVRTPAEHASAHYSGSINIPLQDLRNRLAEVGDKKKAVVVYCASGRRSAEAARILKAAGFTDVTNAGGLSSLQAHQSR